MATSGTWFNVTWGPFPTLQAYPSGNVTTRTCTSTATTPSRRTSHPEGTLQHPPNHGMRLVVARRLVTFLRPWLLPLALSLLRDAWPLPQASSPQICQTNNSYPDVPTTDVDTAALFRMNHEMDADRKDSTRSSPRSRPRAELMPFHPPSAPLWSHHTQSKPSSRPPRSTDRTWAVAAGGPPARLHLSSSRRRTTRDSFVRPCPYRPHPYPLRNGRATSLLPPPPPPPSPIRAVA